MNETFFAADAGFFINAKSWLTLRHMNKAKKTIFELTTTDVEAYRRQPKKPLVLVCDSVRSMNNVGSLFRTCDAFGIERMVLCGITGRPPHPEIAKTALGADESVRWEYETDALEACRRLKSEGYDIVVLEQAHGSIDPRGFNPEPGRRYALVVGNEVDGVSQEIVDLADIVIEIAQCGVKHSLNVAVSGGIALWAMASKFA